MPPLGLALAWLVFGWFRVAFGLSLPFCLLVVVFLLGRCFPGWWLVAGLFVPFPQSAFVRLLGFVPWLTVGLLVSFSSPLLGGFPWPFSLQGPLGSCWLSWLPSLGPLFPVARM